ncbi:MAG: hypothetical protein IJU76_04360 [Desulfovibrionaceae bacterium]|nr:hypothetical protein [Desulfovibrionaceae bacterium]
MNIIMDVQRKNDREHKQTVLRDTHVVDTFQNEHSSVKDGDISFAEYIRDKICLPMQGLHKNIVESSRMSCLFTPRGQLCFANLARELVPKKKKNVKEQLILRRHLIKAWVSRRLFPQPPVKGYPLGGCGTVRPFNLFEP